MVEFPEWERSEAGHRAPFAGFNRIRFQEFVLNPSRGYPWRLSLHYSRLPVAAEHRRTPRTRDVTAAADATLRRRAGERHEGGGRTQGRIARGGRVPERTPPTPVTWT